MNINKYQVHAYVYVCCLMISHLLMIAFQITCCEWHYSMYFFQFEELVIFTRDRMAFICLQLNLQFQLGRCTWFIHVTKVANFMSSKYETILHYKRMQQNDVQHTAYFDIVRSRHTHYNTKWRLFKNFQFYLTITSPNSWSPVDSPYKVRKVFPCHDAIMLTMSRAVLCKRAPENCCVGVLLGTL